MKDLIIDICSSKPFFGIKVEKEIIPFIYDFAIEELKSLIEELKSNCSEKDSVVIAEIPNRRSVKGRTPKKSRSNESGNESSDNRIISEKHIDLDKRLREFNEGE